MIAIVLLVSSLAVMWTTGRIGIAMSAIAILSVIVASICSLAFRKPK